MIKFLIDILDEPEYEQGPGEKMVINLQDAPETLADKLEESELAIFANSAPMKASDLSEENHSGILSFFFFQDHLLSISRKQ